MKILLFALFAFFFLTDAMEVTDEDINSPLVSYLLAKVKRLEGKMMDKPNVRNIREVEKRSIDTNTSADVKNTKDCPQQVVTYIRWGNTTCPYGANTIYKGIILFIKELLQEVVMIIKVQLLICCAYHLLILSCVIQTIKEDKYQLMQ